MRLPHPLVLLGGAVLVSAGLTWILPAGQYDRRDDPGALENMQEEIIPLMAILLAAGVPFTRWIRFALGGLLLLAVVGVVSLTIAR